MTISYLQTRSVTSLKSIGFVYIHFFFIRQPWIKENKIWYRLNRYLCISLPDFKFQNKLIKLNLKLSILKELDKFIIQLTFLISSKIPIFKVKWPTSCVPDNKTHLLILSDENYDKKHAFNSMILLYYYKNFNNFNVNYKMRKKCLYITSY